MGMIDNACNHVPHHHGIEKSTMMNIIERTLTLQFRVTLRVSLRPKSNAKSCFPLRVSDPP